MDSSKESVSSRHNWKMHIWTQNRKSAEVQVTWGPSTEICVEGIDAGSYLLARSYLQLICLQAKGKFSFLQWNVTGFVNHTSGEAWGMEVFG